MKKKLVLRRDTLRQLELVRGGWDEANTLVTCGYEGCANPVPSVDSCNTLGLSAEPGCWRG